jgi:hypothetical protein
MSGAKAYSTVRQYRSALLAMIGMLALMTGALVYLAGRPTGSAYFLPAWATLAQQAGGIFGTADGFLPSFTHVFAFTLLTAAVMRPRSLRGTAVVAGAWCATDVLFEIGQHPAIASTVSAALPVWFGGLPMLDNVGPYFLHGTFDPADIAATVAGAAVAYLMLALSDHPRRVS